LFFSLPLEKTGGGQFRVDYDDDENFLEIRTRDMATSAKPGMYELTIVTAHRLNGSNDDWECLVAPPLEFEQVKAERRLSGPIPFGAISWFVGV
jgi:hypothetical protein